MSPLILDTGWDFKCWMAISVFDFDPKERQRRHQKGALPSEAVGRLELYLDESRGREEGPLLLGR